MCRRNKNKKLKVSLSPETSETCYDARRFDRLDFEKDKGNIYASTIYIKSQDDVFRLKRKKGCCILTRKDGYSKEIEHEALKGVIQVGENFKVAGEDLGVIREIVGVNERLKCAATKVVRQPEATLVSSFYNI